MSNLTGNGGFYFPKVYEKAQRQIENCLSLGKIDYAELTKWTFPDEFLCFILNVKLLPFVDTTYPNPREKNEVPIWFLITCQFLMRVYQTGKYQDLTYLLHSGSILTRFGYNVGCRKIGFNDKNKKERKTAVHHDTVRKFFKDTNPSEIRSWYQQDLQSWFRSKKVFHHQGIFILDQTHLVVPDNGNYKDAVKMPVDEHGQWYSNLNKLTDEQKRSLNYHPCYTLSTLLNAAPSENFFHITAYELGPGNEDELDHAKRLIPSICHRQPGLIKELIVDRGYISGEFFSKIKQDHGIDILVPLRTDMHTYQDAVSIAQHKNTWKTIDIEKDQLGNITSQTEAVIINDIDLWDNAKFKQQVTVSKCKEWSEKEQDFCDRYFVLASSKKYRQPEIVVQRYKTRVQIEERFRQFKHSWYIAEFPSPNASLIESHVCFTLLTYSLVQLYLRRKDLQKQTNKMMSSLKAQEQLGKDAVLIYASNQYGVLDLDDYTIRVTEMDGDPRQRLNAVMQKQKEARLKREQ